jgi:hypothetical protein
MVLYKWYENSRVSLTLRRRGRNALDKGVAEVPIAVMRLTFFLTICWLSLA